MLYFLISLVALFGVNIWHFSLLQSFKGQNRPDTISEHAYSTSRNLRIHRIFHIIASVSLISYAILELLPSKQYLLAGLLVLGALMDVIEVSTLRKEDPTHPISATPHQISAWLMASSYLVYGVLVVRNAGLPSWLYHGVWLLFAVNLTIAAFYKFKKFWLSQMFYFSVLAIIIAIAHYRII